MVTDFLREFGENMSMIYGCNESITLHYWALNALNTYGYTTAIKAYFRPQQIKTELNAGRLVYIGGCQGTVNCGHIWIAEAYHAWNECPSNKGYLYIYMNWGWNGSHNAWYAHGYWSPGNVVYDSHKTMIYNIRP